MLDLLCCTKTFSTLTIPLFTTVLGAILGGVITWCIMTEASRKASRRDALLDLAETIEGFRSYYNGWYIHLTSPAVIGNSADVVKMPWLYHHYLEEAEKHKGRLIAIRAALVAYFPGKGISPLRVSISELLDRTGFSATDTNPVTEVDKMVKTIRDSIPALLETYT